MRQCHSSKKFRQGSGLSCFSNLPARLESGHRIRPLWSPHQWKSVPVSMPAAEIGIGIASGNQTMASENPIRYGVSMEVFMAQSYHGVFSIQPGLTRADAQPGPAMASGKACVAENDLPLPLAFSGLRCPRGWDWGDGGYPQVEHGCQ